MKRSHATTASGFSIMELLIAITIFLLLGSMVIVLMRQALDIFSTGTRESALLDRQGLVVPQIQRDLMRVYVGDDFAPPPPPPTDEELLEMDDPPPPPPPVWIRLRAGWITLKDQAEGALEDTQIYYCAFVTDLSEDLPRLLRRQPTGTAEAGAVPFTPATAENPKSDTVFLPSGGKMEVAYVALPEDPAKPSILTLYRGFRTPVGDPEKSLLVPEHLDTLEEVQAALRPIARGVLHFSMLWRRVHARDWQLRESPVGPDGDWTRVVSTRWDSTRALDRKFAMYAGSDSLGDPSDDVFPAFVQVEVTLASATAFGFGRGELSLRQSLNATDTRVSVTSANRLLVQGLGSERYLKVGTEWMAYSAARVDVAEGEVRVRRGVRGSSPESHRVGDWVHIGQPSSMEIRLPVYQDTYTIPGDTR